MFKSTLNSEAILTTSIKFGIVILFLTYCEARKYEKFKLFRGIPVSEKDLDFFKNMGQNYDVNFWQRPGLLYKAVEFTIGPQDMAPFIADVTANKIYLTTIIDDVQSAFDNQTVKTYIRRKMDSFDWTSYYRLNDIYNWMADLSKLYPTEIQLMSIGKTIEKRDILAMKISLTGCRKRSTVFLEGGIHAREWVAPAFVTYMIHQVLHANDSGNSELINVATLYEWIFVPIANPDGYEYSHTKDRMWRKNRRGHYGVDINRNFGVAFGTVGITKSDKSDETYCGEYAFSEPESTALSQFVRANSENLEYYLAFHSYGQLFIIPYAYTTDHLENFDEMKRLSDYVSTKIAQRYKTEYTVGTANDVLGYLGSGVSSDWVKKAFKTPYVATMELRDQGTHGFALPPQEIQPTCEETMDGLLALLIPGPRKFPKLREELPLTGACAINRVTIIYALFIVILWCL